MFKRKLLKQPKLKRFILKLLNVYAYDKETLNIINPNIENFHKKFIKFNDKSFIFSRGFLNLTRKIKKLDIFFRYSPNNNLWNSSKGAQRIIKNINKKTLISVCLLSLKKSLESMLNNLDVEVCVNLIGDNSDKKFDEHISKILKHKKISIKNHIVKIVGNRGSYLECCDQAESSEDLILFVEDDYLFEQHCIEEMLLSYSRISSLIKKDIIMCPADYPFYYDALYSTSLFLGSNYKWRSVGETLLTIMFSKKIYEENKENIKLVGEQINDPFEKPLHEIYKNNYCLAPIGSLAYHISRHVPDVQDEWKNLWNENYQNYLDNYLTRNYSQKK